MRNGLIVGLVVAMGFGTFGSSASLAAPVGYETVYEENFSTTYGNVGGFNPDDWQYQELGGRRDATNVQDAVSVGNGKLTIRTYTNNGNHYTTMVRSKKTWTHGYFESSIRFKGDPGMWSAFWLYRNTIWSDDAYSVPGRSPATSGVEVDIVEHHTAGWRQPNNSSSVSNSINTALHWDGYGANHKVAGKVTSIPNLYDGEFHTYAAEWLPDGYKLFVDGVEIWDTRDNSASDGNDTAGIVSQVAQFIILSSEVQDNTWVGMIPSGGYGLRGAASNPTMEVDWVRVSQLAAVPEPGTIGLAAVGALGLLARRRR